jgi:hypothetical protein
MLYPSKKNYKFKFGESIGSNYHSYPQNEVVMAVASIQMNVPELSDNLAIVEEYNQFAAEHAADDSNQTLEILDELTGKEMRYIQEMLLQYAGSSDKEITVKAAYLAEKLRPMLKDPNLAPLIRRTLSNL